MPAADRGRDRRRGLRRFVRSCLAKAASLAAAVAPLIRALITAAPVAGFDETTLRSGQAGEKKYVHGAFTEEYSAFWLSTRSLDSMQDAGILRASPGSWAPTGTEDHFQLQVGAHRREPGVPSDLLRGFRGLRRELPGGSLPVQAQRALRGLIDAWHAAREQGLDAVPPAGRRNCWQHESGTPLVAGRASLARVPGRRTARSRSPAASC